MAGGKKQAAGAARQSATQEDKCHPRKIFIGGLASDTATQDLRDYFGQFGSIVDAVVLRWPDGRSRGFGYVTFAGALSSSALLAGTHTVGGQEVDVKRAVPGTNKLFVGGLPQNTTAAELREHFEAFGVVSDAVVMIDPATGRSRGFGFVCFEPGQEGASAVAAALAQYKNHRIRGKWIEVKSAAPPHKFLSPDAAGAATPPELHAARRTSPAGTPPPCTTPPPALGLLALGAQTAAEGYGPAPLPKLLGPAGWVEPQKVLLPPGTAAPIGAPPGLDRAGPGAAPWGQALLGLPGHAAARAQQGAVSAIPRPGSFPAAVAAQQAAWWSGPTTTSTPRGHSTPTWWSTEGPAGGPLGPGCPAKVAAAWPLAQPPGRFGGTTRHADPPGQAGAGAQGDLGTALHRSLEELLRLKMRGSEELGSPGQLAVA